MPGGELTRIDSATGVQPFLKWPGGKRWLLRRGLRVPDLGADATYFEPFLGGGSFFFALNPPNAVLADMNPHLISAYSGLRARPGAVITALKKLRSNKTTYQRMRTWAPTTQVDRAIRLIYLNRTAFSGLYRENRKGEFNVPYGGYTDRHLCQESVLRAAARALCSVRLESTPFSDVVSVAVPGDLVYFDPPYISGHQNNGFVRYNRHLFTWEHQETLADVAKRLADKGVHVIVSNARHDDVLALYKDFNVDLVSRNSQVSPHPRFRKITTEAVIASYEGAFDG